MKYGKGNPLLKKKGRKSASKGMAVEERKEGKADNPAEERQEKKGGFVPFKKKKK